MFLPIRKGKVVSLFRWLAHVQNRIVSVTCDLVVGAAGSRLNLNPRHLFVLSRQIEKIRG